MQPDVVFLDFDRTLCATKGGAAPIPGKHAGDADLLALVRRRRAADKKAADSNTAEVTPPRISYI